MKLTCVHCGGEFRGPPDARERVVCPFCKGYVTLPKTSSAQAVALEEEEHHAPVKSGLLSNSISSLISVVLHMTLLLVLATVSCNQRGGGGNDLEGEEVQIGHLATEVLEDRAEESLESTASESPSQDDFSLDSLDEVASPVSSAESSDLLDVSIGALSPSGGGEAGGSIGQLAGGGSGLGGATFMGIHAKGQRFCIIADKSGSMFGPKMEHLKREILETLRSMNRRAQFQIIFFSDTGFPFPKRTWLNPKADRRSVETWLQDRVEAAGGTFPTPAFELAFQLNPPPDVIFFMTDGNFDARVVGQIRALNKRSERKAIIHAISFIDDAAEAEMKEIAADSGGTYRHVSGF